MTSFLGATHIIDMLTKNDDIAYFSVDESGDGGKKYVENKNSYLAHQKY